MWFYRTYGMQFLAFRYGSVIGPGRRDGGASAYAQLMLQKPAQGEPYTVHVPESSRIPIVYVKDAVAATFTAYRKSKSLRDRIFNVGSLSPIPSALELANSVRTHVSGAKIDFEPEEKATQIVNSWPRDMAISRLSQIGWKPTFGNVDSIVADFVAEVRQKPGMFKI
jgi:nucleoside-diphosphate-sugar epimerase